MECPGCHEAISGKLETCPHCFYDLRALRSGGAGPKKPGLPGYEDLDGPDPEVVEPVPERHVDNVQYKPKASPFRYVLLAMVFVLGVALFYLAKDFMRERRAAEEMSAAIASKPAQALPPAATAAATVPVEPEPPAEPEAEAPAPEAPAPAAPAPVEAVVWRFEGRVYDILSLKPVAGANLTFLADDGGQGGAVSGADGRFRVKLPSTPGGYRLVVDQSDYDGDHFDDPSANYRAMTLAARAALRNSVPKHRAWKGAAGTVRRDIALFPLSPDSQE